MKISDDRISKISTRVCHHSRIGMEELLKERAELLAIVDAARGATSVCFNANGRARLKALLDTYFKEQADGYEIKYGPADETRAG